MSRLTFFCDLAEAMTPLPNFWEHTVGSDHAPLALRDVATRSKTSQRDYANPKRLWEVGGRPEDRNDTIDFSSQNTQITQR